MAKPSNPGGVLFPVGSIIAFAGDVDEPAMRNQGWLPCNGAEIRKKDFPLLFKVIHAKYGAGPQPDVVRLPNLIGRVPLGATEGTSLGTKNAAPAVAAGTEGGIPTVTLGKSEIPSHSHLITDHGHTHGNEDGGDHPTKFYVPSGYGRNGRVGNGNFGCSAATLAPSKTGIELEPTGGGQPHENMPPFLAINFLIRWR